MGGCVKPSLVGFGSDFCRIDKVPEKRGHSFHNLCDLMQTLRPRAEQIQLETSKTEMILGPFKKVIGAIDPFLPRSLLACIQPSTDSTGLLVRGRTELFSKPGKRHGEARIRAACEPQQ